MQFNNLKIQKAYELSLPVIKEKIKFLINMKEDFFNIEKFLYEELGEMNFIYDINEHESLIYTHKLTYHDFNRDFEQSIHETALPIKIKIYNEIPQFINALVNFLLCKD